jgi:3-hydroxyisobutyrate dehydrogenase-like beta-hydroxyacid dehydrogenase
MDKRIGFIGLGEMGFPMALNLIKHGYQVNAFNRSEKPLLDLKREGGEMRNSPRDVAEASDTIIVMVRTTDQAQRVIVGEDGILQGAREGATILVMSTIDPMVARNMALLAGEKGVELLDCPVSGARPRAEAGTLTIMVGGSEEALEEVRPILEVLGQHIFYLGDHGTGQVAKLVNNLMLLVHMNAAYEGLALAKKGGVNLDALLDLLKVSTGNSWIIENWPLVASWKDNYKEGGTLDLIYKDINTTLALGESLKVPLHLASLAKQLGRY